MRVAGGITRDGGERLIELLEVIFDHREEIIRARYGVEITRYFLKNCIGLLVLFCLGEEHGSKVDRLGAVRMRRQYHVDIRRCGRILALLQEQASALQPSGD